MFRAGVVLGELHFLPADDIDDGHAFRQFGGGLDRVGQTALDAGFDDQPVDDDFDIMLVGLLEFDVLGEVAHFPVDAGPDEAGLGCVLEGLGKGTLFPPGDGRHDLDTRTFGQRHDLIDDLVDGLVLDLPSADRTVRYTDAGVHETHVVVDLRQRTHRGTGVLRGRLLVDGDGRRQAVDGLDLRLVHDAEELTGVGRQRLHVPALAFGEDRIEGKGGLAGARKPGKDHHLFPRDVEVDVFEVVFSRTDDADLFICHRILWSLSFLSGLVGRGDAVGTVTQFGDLVPVVSRGLEV